VCVHLSIHWDHPKHLKIVNAWLKPSSQSECDMLPFCYSTPLEFAEWIPKSRAANAAKTANQKPGYWNPSMFSLSCFQLSLAKRSTMTRRTPGGRSQGDLQKEACPPWNGNQMELGWLWHGYVAVAQKIKAPKEPPKLVNLSYETIRFWG
jgi:hypothetical protein